MTAVLDLMNKRNIYVYTILFKIYLDTYGRIDMQSERNLKAEIKELSGDDFDNNVYNSAEHYLISEGLVANYAINRLSINGRNHFEKWINDFIDLDLTTKEEIGGKLSPKLKSFLGITKDSLIIVKTASDFLQQYYGN